MKGPLFICGLPRAGTTALWRALRKHPEFINDTYSLKEPRFYESFLGSRAWGKVDTFPVSANPIWKNVDDDYVRRGVAMIDELLRKYSGGRGGRYISANPSDAFYIPYILDSVPDAKFVILLRHPLENIWSNVNYPRTGSDGQRDFSTRNFDQQAVSQWARRWTDTLQAVDRAINSPARDACRIVEHRDLVIAPEETLQRIGELAAIEIDEEIIERLVGLLRHSSFRRNEPMSPAEKIAHFDVQRAEAARHPAIVAAAIECLEATAEVRAKLGLNYTLPTAAP